MINWLKDASKHSPWHDARVVVTGLGARGYCAADVLLEMGAQVIVLDDSHSHDDQVRLIEILGGEVRPDAGGLPACDLIIAPDEGPDSPRLTEAGERGVPVWSDVELAWRLSQPFVPWLGVTGTQGVGDTVALLESMLAAAGLRVSAAGMDVRPIGETILDEVSYEVLAVGMSDVDLMRSPSVRFHSATVLTLEPDDEPGEYARIYHQVSNSCVYNVGEPRTEAMVEEADVIEGARAIGFTTGIPAISMLGVVDEFMVDRAFIAQRRDSALELARTTDIPAGMDLTHVLAAAALARSFGVPATAVRDGIRTFAPGRPHTNPPIEQGEK